MTKTSKQRRISKGDVAHEDKGDQKPLRVSKWLIENSKDEVLLRIILEIVLNFQQRRESNPSNTLKT